LLEGQFVFHAMKRLSTTSPLLILLVLLSQCSNIAAEKPPGKNAILLSKVKSLTLHANRATTSRRVSPIPQLNCVGASRKTCELYPVESMRCINQGYGYDEEDIQWTCETQLPSEFKLGSTDVICEGYRSADDKWVLKGSCGVEYRLVLTEIGEQRFRHMDRSTSKIAKKSWGDFVFYVIFIAVLGFIFLWVFTNVSRSRGTRQNDGRNSGWPWGGGGGPFDDPRGPPPPYDYTPRRANSKPWYSNTYTSSSWTPGFWTGALSGTAAGYSAGSWNQRQSRPRGSTWRWGRNEGDPGEGSSRSVSSFSSVGPSTGFGSTRRR